MRVLVGIDGSEGSLEAVRWADRLWSGADDTLYLYYAPPAVRASGGLTSDEAVDRRLRQVLVESVVQRSTHEIDAERRARVQVVVGEASAPRGILAAADEQRADVIVVGSHRMNVLQRAMVGSVSRRVAHEATVPVLVVRSPSEAPRPTGPLRVLVACDRTPASRAAHHFLQHVRWPLDTEARVLSVFESVVGEVPEWLHETLAREAGVASTESWDIFASDKKKAHTELIEWCVDLPAPFKRHAPEVVTGRAARAILESIHAHPVDLVIVGARRQSELGRLLLGSTSDAVLQHAPCAVLVARERPLV